MKSKFAVRDRRSSKWFWLDKAFIDEWGGKLKPTAIAVYCVLARYANDSTQGTFVSESTIAQAIGRSISAVKRAIKVLEKASLIKKEVRPGKTNIIYLLPVEGPGSLMTQVTNDPGHQRPGSQVTNDLGVRSLVTYEQTYSNNHILTNPDKIWQIALHDLKLRMTKATFDAWLKNTSLISYEDGTFIIGVPSAYAKEWLEHRLLATIKRTLNDLVDQPAEVKFAVRAEEK